MCRNTRLFRARCLMQPHLKLKRTAFYTHTLDFFVPGGFLQQKATVSLHHIHRTIFTAETCSLLCMILHIMQISFSIQRLQRMQEPYVISGTSCESSYGQKRVTKAVRLSCSPSYLTMKSRIDGSDTAPCNQ